MGKIGLFLPSKAASRWCRMAVRRHEMTHRNQNRKDTSQVYSDCNICCEEHFVHQNFEMIVAQNWVFEDLATFDAPSKGQFFHQQILNRFLATAVIQVQIQ